MHAARRQRHKAAGPRRHKETPQGTAKMARQQSEAMAERLKLLTQTGGGTDMGRLLRLFWQPVATSHSIKPGAARPLRVMGEDLTLYRGESGAAHLVAGRCAHRRTVPHTGW